MPGVQNTGIFKPTFWCVISSICNLSWLNENELKLRTSTSVFSRVFQNVRCFKLTYTFYDVLILPAEQFECQMTLTWAVLWSNVRRQNYAIRQVIESLLLKFQALWTGNFHGICYSLENLSVILQVYVKTQRDFAWHSSLTDLLHPYLTLQSWQNNKLLFKSLLRCLST